MRRPLSAWRLSALRPGSMIAAFALLIACQTSPAPPPPKKDAEAAPSSQRQDWPELLRFGLAPHLNEQTPLKDFDALGEYLEKKVGVKFEFVISEGYEDLAEKLLRHEIDLGDFPPLNYVEVKARDPEVTLLVRQIATGTSSYGSYLITRQKSGIKSLSDLRGKRFAFVDPRSTSGYLFPLASLLEAGLDPARDLGKIRYLGTHEAVIKAVLAGEADVGAIWSGAIAEAQQHGIATGSLSILHKSERIPYDAFIARSGLPPDLLRALKEAFLSLSTGTEEGRRILTALPSQMNGFVPSEDKEYDTVREVQKRVEARLGKDPLPESPD